MRRRPKDDDDDDPALLCTICGLNPHKTGRGQLWTNAPRHEQCWHRFCDRCLERVRKDKTGFKCPECGSTVRGKGVTLFALSRDAIEAERDAKARKRVTEVYNRARDTFESAEEFENYREMIEDSIIKLSAGGEDAKSVEAALKKYETAHIADVHKRKLEKSEEKSARIARIRESAALAGAAAKRERDEDRRKELDRRIYEKHRQDYELGDRPDPPKQAEPEEPAVGPREWPLPVQLDAAATRPLHVPPDELAQRRSAAAWSTRFFAARALLDLLLPTCTETALNLDPHASKKRRLLEANAIQLYAPKIHIAPAGGSS